MTTPIVPSISDEQLADIERHLSEQPSRSICCDVENHEVESIIARLRAAEADAKRYRWLRDKSVDADGVYPMVSLTDDCGDQVSNWLFGQAVDKAVDEAMERTP